MYRHNVVHPYIQSTTILCDRKVVPILEVLYQRFYCYSIIMQSSAVIITLEQLTVLLNSSRLFHGEVERQCAGHTSCTHSKRLEGIPDQVFAGVLRFPRTREL